MGDMIRCHKCSTHHYRNDPCPEGFIEDRKQAEEYMCRQEERYWKGKNRHDEWMYEDELPDDYDYDANFARSEIRDGVRMFPVKTN